MATPLRKRPEYLPGTAAAPFFQNERFPDCSQLLLPTADIIEKNYIVKR